MEARGIEDVTGLDGPANTTVPAGRYFAAVSGPKLDQVKVTYKS